LFNHFIIFISASNYDSCTRDKKKRCAKQIKSTIEYLEKQKRKNSNNKKNGKTKNR